MEIPEFRLYGQADPDVEENIQPKLALREWSDLNDDEKKTTLQELQNRGWVEDSDEILHTIEYLNSAFLRQCPGENLHAIIPKADYEGVSSNKSERREAACKDFSHVLLHETSDAMVYRMLSKLAGRYINGSWLDSARQSNDDKEREKFLADAYKKFDRLARCLNHIFEQFSVNQLVTRSGFVPRQDPAIATGVYVPTMRILGDPRWKPVSDDLASAFDDYRERNFAEAITRAHTAVHRFLQILAGEEGKSGKGEVGKLFNKAKDEGLIPVNRFTEPFLDLIARFVVSERATNSTAKPTLKEATSSDALLVLNTVMVFLQFCLQQRAR